MEKITVHECGFVILLDTMGSDEEVENAARISYGQGTRKVSETRNLLRYLMRHKHTSPFEMCEVKFHMKLPIFVMRQIIRHRTANVNEYSGRYSIMSDDFYHPHIDDIQQQSKQNNQGRGDDVEDKASVNFEINRAHDNAHQTYLNLLELNVARELSRVVLPVSNYTEVVWKIDLHNFFHFCKLRTNSHAQKEVRDYANVMYELVKKKFPLSCEAYEDYALNAVSFSHGEMCLLKDCLNDASLQEDIFGETLIQDDKDFRNRYNLSKREVLEFKDKFKNLRTAHGNNNE